MKGAQVSETLLAEELDRVIQSAVARIEQQITSATQTQNAEVRPTLAGMIRGLELLRARRARLP